MLFARMFRNDRGGQAFLLVLLATLVTVPLLNLVVPPLPCWANI